MPTMGDPRFHKLLQDIGALHDKKQNDYGHDEDPLANTRSASKWGVPAWVGVMIRIGDKLIRLQRYVHTRKLSNEGVEDSLLDIAVYALIALILFREEQDGIKGGSESPRK